MHGRSCRGPRRKSSSSAASSCSTASAAPRIVDVGTGTGAIALALKQERPDARRDGDRQLADALALARENARRERPRRRARPDDLLDGLTGPFDLVVSNPPYVGADELDAPSRRCPTGSPKRRSSTGPDGSGSIEAAQSCGWLVLEVHERRATGGRASARSCGLQRRLRVAGPRGPRPDRRGPMDAVEALRAGLPVLLPTDTVYGLVSAPGEDAARTLYELKGRAQTQPTAVLAATRRGAAPGVPELDADGSASCCRAHTRSSSPTPPVASRGSPGERRDRSASASRSSRRDERHRRRAGHRARDERERSRRPEPGHPRRRAAANPRRLRRGARPRAAPGDAVDGDRRHGARSRASSGKERFRGWKPSAGGAHRIPAWPSPSRPSSSSDGGARRCRPADRRAARSGARPPARPDRADRLRELHVAVGARGGRLGPDQQVRRGLPRQALLRRVRGRRRDRGARAHRAKELFGAEHANVQPHAGAQANMAVYFAVLSRATGCSGCRSITAAT